MRQPAQEDGLAADALERGGVTGLLGAHDLDDDERPQAVGPGEVGLVAATAPEEAHRLQARGDLVALVEVPVAHGEHGPQRG